MVKAACAACRPRLPALARGPERTTALPASASLREHLAVEELDRILAWHAPCWSGRCCASGSSPPGVGRSPPSRRWYRRPGRGTGAGRCVRVVARGELRHRVVHVLVFLVLQFQRHDGQAVEEEDEVDLLPRLAEVEVRAKGEAVLGRVCPLRRSRPSGVSGSRGGTPARALSGRGAGSSTAACTPAPCAGREDFFARVACRSRRPASELSACVALRKAQSWSSAMKCSLSVISACSSTP
jgi:hypothetical protein